MNGPEECKEKLTSFFAREKYVSIGCWCIRWGTGHGGGAVRKSES